MSARPRGTMAGRMAARCVAAAKAAPAGGIRGDEAAEAQRSDGRGAAQ